MKQYLDMCKYVLENGENREDRTGTGTRSEIGRASCRERVSSPV